MDTNSKNKEIMDVVLSLFEEKLDAPMEFNFKAGGKTYPLTCTDDCLVASAQRMKKVAEAILEDIRKEDNYHKEKAAVRLLRLFESYEKLAASFAEMHQSYPEAASALQQQIPAFATLEHSGSEVWERIKDKV